MFVKDVPKTVFEGRVGLSCNEEYPCDPSGMSIGKLVDLVGWFVDTYTEYTDFSEDLDVEGTFRITVEKLS